jgi:hypothetical protein
MNVPPIASGRRAARLLIVAILVGSTGIGGTAAESTPPIRSHLQPVSELARGPVSGESLGIRLSRASAVLRQQLALARGAGLVVDEVAAGTQAERAGFQRHDVLVRLDDQLLVLPQQFDALLEAAATDDPLTCTVLRGGRELSISLTGRPAAAVAAAGVAPPAPSRRPLRPTASSLALVGAPASTPPAAISDGRLRRLSDETLLRQDADFEIRLSRGDQTRLVVRDRAGRIVFDGPIDAAADRGRVPEVVRSRVATMERLLEPRPALAGDAPGRPVAEIGQLEIAPLELR